MNSHDIFEQEFIKILQPKLDSLGFEQIQLKRPWFHQHFLFEHNDIWFGTSWDWRDLVLDIRFGRLFYYADVLPGVVIIGHVIIESYSNIPIRFDNFEQYFQTRFTEVVNTLDERVKNFEEEYPNKLESYLKGDPKAGRKQRQYHRQFLSHLGKQLTKTEIPYL